MTSQDRASSPVTIRPASFAAAGSGPQRPAGDRRHGWLFALTLVLGLGVVFVVAVLPRLLTTPSAGLPTTAAEAIDAPPVTPAPNAHASVAGEDEAARNSSQAALDETLQALVALESRGAETWAKTALHEIRNAVAAGEKAYREKRYPAADAAYADARRRIAALEADIPAITAGLRDAGKLALASGDSAAAVAAYERVLVITPDDAEAAAGRTRATTLDQVVALVDQGAGFERMGEIDKAVAAYREALAVDAQAPGAASAIERIEQGRRAARFRAAMSDGLRALEAHEFAAAREAFERAARFDPTSSEVSAARAHLAATETAWNIDRQLARARAAEQGERWTEAATAYDAALALDDKLDAARSARSAASERARLDTVLEGYLARPARLDDAAVRDEALAVLARARAGGARGTRLDDQLARLDRALVLARTPLEVTLHSDGATVVSVQRIGELGRFDQRNLSLLPGRYVASGQRDGYRDVRVEFDVAHGADPAAVVVQCVESFAPGS
ncbi:MAG: hypothetical protein AB7Q81_02885 [Gammaproteobacteria bacterium]